jgi:hypothetical protein
MLVTDELGNVQAFSGDTESGHMAAASSAAIAHKAPEGVAEGRYRSSEMVEPIWRRRECISAVCALDLRPR